MYNGNGKKIEWWWRELGLPRELVLPESWAFRFTRQCQPALIVSVVKISLVFTPPHGVPHLKSSPRL